MESTFQQNLILAIVAALPGILMALPGLFTAIGNRDYNKALKIAREGVAGIAKRALDNPEKRHLAIMYVRGHLPNAVADRLGLEKISAIVETAWQLYEKPRLAEPEEISLDSMHGPR